MGSERSVAFLKARQFFLMALIVLGPIQWIKVADVGLSLRLAHFPFFVLAGFGYFDLVNGRLKRSILNPIVPFAIFFLVYIFGLLLAGAISGFDAGRISKPLLYAFLSFGVFICCTSLPYDKLLSSFLFGGIVSAAAFVLIAGYTLQMKGISLFDTVVTAVKTGDSKSLQFKIFFNIFNESSIRTDDSVGVSLRNSLMGFIFITYCISMSGLLRGSRLVVSMITVFLSLVIILVSVSRSNILVTVLASVAPLIAYSRENKKFALFLPVLGLFFILLIIALVDLSGVLSIFTARFSNFSEDGRLDMFSTALSEIDRNVFFGSGLNSTISTSADKEHVVHNLFLAAWMQGGLITLFGAIGYTVTVLIFLKNRLSQFSRSPSDLFIAGLLILPLFRSQISGDGGNYPFSEWVCLSFAAAYFVSISRARHFSKQNF